MMAVGSKPRVAGDYNGDDDDVRVDQGKGRRWFGDDDFA